MIQLKAEERARLAAQVYRELHPIVGGLYWAAELMRAVLTLDPHGNFVNWRHDGPCKPPAAVMNVLRESFDATSPLWRFIIMDRLCGETKVYSGGYLRLLSCDLLKYHTGAHACGRMAYRWPRTQRPLNIPGYLLPLAMKMKSHEEDRVTADSEAVTRHLAAAEAWEELALSFCSHPLCDECQQNIKNAEMKTGEANDATMKASLSVFAFAATVAAVMAVATRDAAAAASAHRRAAAAPHDPNGRFLTPIAITVCYANGDRVRHYGTKQWGEVLQSVPQSDGGYEYEIKRDDGTTGWWANYHIDRHEGGATNGG